MVKVAVKWEKETYEVDVDLSQPAMVFKVQLFTLTGVPTERQKIMGVKSAPLKDDADMNASGIKEVRRMSFQSFGSKEHCGSKLMMLGRADVLVAPEKPIQFLEDMPVNVQAAAAMKNFSPGLENLGNTCYMNSCIQCLYSVPELHDALATFTPANGEQGAVDTRLALATRDLFRQLKNSGDVVTPAQFHAALQQNCPQFQQRTREGHLMQQDAEECWTSIVSTLGRKLRPPAPDGGPVDGALMRQLFGIEFVTKLKCEATGEERTVEETQFAFKCNISGTTNHVNDGFKLSCDMTREQRSEIAGRDVDFTGVSRIAHLPSLLTVQLVRFFWKGGADNIRAKILRAVTFPSLLDVYDYCTDELKAHLDVARERKKKAEEAALGLKMQPDAKKAKQDTGAAAPAPTADGTSAAAATGGDESMPDAASSEPSTSGAGAGAPAPALQQTGFFELRAVLTHKGRTADSGHYIGWVKQKDGSWMQFDDERPIPATEEQVLRLSGGRADDAMAYMLLYRAVLA